MSKRKAPYYLQKAMLRYAGATPNKVNRVAKQYGYEKGCIVPGCKLPPRVHHIVARREGGTNALTNLMPICYDHETRLHKAGTEYRRMIALASAGGRASEAGSHSDATEPLQHATARSAGTPTSNRPTTDR